MSQATTGIMLIPISLASLVVTPISGILCDKFDAKKLCFIGMSISTLGLFQTPNTYAIIKDMFFVLK